MAAQRRIDLVLDSVKRLLRIGATANLLNLLQKQHPADLAQIFSEFQDREREATFSLLAERNGRLAMEAVSELGPAVGAGSGSLEHATATTATVSAAIISHISRLAFSFRNIEYLPFVISPSVSSPGDFPLLSPDAAVASPVLGVNFGSSVPGHGRGQSHLLSDGV